MGKAKTDKQEASAALAATTVLAEERTVDAEVTDRHYVFGAVSLR